MPADNFTRMIQLATEFFDAKNDPAQLDIDESVMERLTRLHPATMGEERDEHGPIAWTIVIPAAREDMEEFLNRAIGERELLDRSEKRRDYDAIYLCSALVLPEYRRRGLAKELLCNSIRAIQRDYPITYLFYWAFGEEGEATAKEVAREVNMTIVRRT